MSEQIKKPMFSNKALVALTLPMVLDALLAIIAGMVDSVMVSSAGETAVSAVSLVDSINLLFISTFSALGIGGAVVTSQYIGNKDIDRAGRAANQLMYVSAVIPLVVTAVLMCFVPQIINLVYPGIEERVFENCKTYFYYTLLGYPFFAIGNSCMALMRAMARSRLALVLATGVNILNVIGNAILIYGFDMGVAGAAISTTAARVIWAVGGVVILHSKSLTVHFKDLFRFKLDFDIMRRVMRIGMANGLEGGLFHLGKILVASLVSSFGTIAIAANSVANTICSVGWNSIGAVGSALLTVVGQCMGAGETGQAKMYTKKMANFAVVMVVLLFGSIFLFRDQVVSMFNFSGEALEASAYFTGAAALLTIASTYGWSFVPVNAFRASGDVKYTVTLALSTMFAFRVGLAYLLGGVLKMGLIGVWIGMSVDWFTRAVCNFLRYRSGKWLEKKVI